MVRRYLALSLPLLLAWWLYGYGLRLPYFLDDGPHFQILGQTNGLQHWGDFAPFPFYRPVAFSIWKLFEGVHYPAFALHALNILTFGMAGVMVGQLTRRLAGTISAGVIAGCAFILFPFSYQAVAMVAALFHLTLILGVLVCLWAATKPGRAALLICWIAGFLGVFSHENGILLAPLLIGYLGVMRHGRFTRRDTLVILPNVAIVALYTVLWLTFSPNDEARSFTQDFPAAFAVMIQGIIYPFAALARPFVEGDIDPLALILSAAVIIGGLLAWQRKLVLFCGVGWYILAVLPAVLFLPAGYVLGQTRLALFASAGGAIFWGVLLAGMLNSRWLRLPAVALMAFSVFISVDFLGMRRADFLHLADYNQQAVDLFIADDVLHTGAIIINAPANITPLDADRRFLIGTEGVLWVDPTLDYSQQFWMNSGLEIRDVSTVAYAATLNAQGFSPQGQMMEGVPLIDLLKSSGQIYQTQFNGEQFYPVRVAGTPQEGVFADFDDITLMAGTAQFAEGALTVSLTWRVENPAPIKIFVHVYCDDAFVAQSDGYAWGNTYPFALWQMGEIQTDIRTIPVEAAESCLQVYVGLYFEQEGAPRLTALDADGARYPDDRVLLPMGG